MNNDISSKGAAILFDSLRISNSNIKELSLASTLVDDKCMKSLGEYIKSNKSITRIDLTQDYITDKGIEILAPYLDGNTTFKWLKLQGIFTITDKSIPILIKMVESSNIEAVLFNSPSINNKKSLAMLLMANTLKCGTPTLNLSSWGINDDDVLEMCQLFKKQGVLALTYLDLHVNNISSKGASLLFDTLKECNSIVTNLDLSNNKINDECMNSLGEYIQHNSYLENLFLAQNEISDKGIEILSDYLIGNMTLKQFHLDANISISDKSIPYLVEAIKGSHLYDIFVNRTMITHHRKPLMTDALKVPFDEREIPIKSNAKSAAKTPT